MGWFSLSIVALVFFGIQKFLFKVVVEKGCSIMQTTAFFMGTVTLLAFSAFALSGGALGDWRFVGKMALLNGTIFLIVTLLRMRSLRYIPSVIAYPIFQLSRILVVLFGLAYFQDSLNTIQIGGIALGIATTPFLSGDQHQEPTRRRSVRIGLLLATGAVFGSAASEIIGKFTAISSSDLFVYIGISYAWNLLASGSYALVSHMRGKRSAQWRTAAKYGILIGVTNFIAFYAELSAFRTGPLSLVAVLSSFSTLVAMGLAAWIYRERLDTKGKLGASLAILSIILLGIRT